MKNYNKDCPPIDCDCGCEEKLWNWVHERPNDREEISKRAMIVACSPIFIGG